MINFTRYIQPCIIKFNVNRILFMIYSFPSVHISKSHFHHYCGPINNLFCIVTRTLVSTSVHSPSILISVELLILELLLITLRLIDLVHLFCLSGEECFSFSISVNFTDAPPDLVSSISPLYSSV